jgi:hypothetical protein
MDTMEHMAKKGMNQKAIIFLCRARVKKEDGLGLPAQFEISGHLVGYIVHLVGDPPNPLLGFLRDTRFGGSII